MSEIPVLIGDEHDGFHVTDDKTAEWCMKKIHEAETDRAMWKAHYEAQMEKVNKAADESIAYFTGKLEEYFATVPHKATKTQESYTLPGGKLVLKQQQPKFETDDDKLVSWLEANGRTGLVKIKKSADWATLKKSLNFVGENAVTVDGEIVPGVKVEQRPNVFKVEME